MEKQCKFCKNNFEITKTKKIFCSQHCSAKFSKQENLKKWKERKTGKFIECHLCKKIKYKYPRDLKHNAERFFCSWECKKDWLKSKEGRLEWKKKGLNPPYLKGKDSPNWKGGISRAYKTGYWSIEYRQWRMAIFLRDNFICQFCNIRGVFLTAHHIKSFAKYPELRFDINNGITLCEECHKLTDNYKGRAKRQTIKQ